MYSYGPPHMARTYIQQLCEDTGCSPEDLPEAMNDREKWRERVRDICASGTTWWWTIIYIYIYIYIIFSLKYILLPILLITNNSIFDVSWFYCFSQLANSKLYKYVQFLRATNSMTKWRHYSIWTRRSLSLSLSLSLFLSLSLNATLCKKMKEQRIYSMKRKEKKWFLFNIVKLTSTFPLLIFHSLSLSLSLLNSIWRPKCIFYMLYL